MAELVIKLDNRPIKIGNYPANWDEMSAKMYLKVCALLANGTNYGTMSIELLKTIFGFKLWFRKAPERWRTLLTLPAPEMHTILHDDTILGYIQKPTGPKTMKIQSFRIGWRKYIAPPTKLTNVCCVELVAAYYAFSQYAKTQNDKELDKLISLLYRPKANSSLFASFEKRYALDKREPLNQLRWNERLKKMHKLPKAVKIAILKQWSAHWQAFEKQYPKIFTKSVKSGGDDSGLMGLMYDVAGTKFGTLKETELAPASDVFTHVSREIEKNKKMEEKFNKGKRKTSEAI